MRKNATEILRTSTIHVLGTRFERSHDFSTRPRGDYVSPSVELTLQSRPRAASLFARRPDLTHLSILRRRRHRRRRRRRRLHLEEPRANARRVAQRRRHGERHVHRVSRQSPSRAALPLLSLICGCFFLSFLSVALDRPVLIGRREGERTRSEKDLLLLVSRLLDVIARGQPRLRVEKRVSIAHRVLLSLSRSRRSLSRSRARVGRRVRVPRIHSRSRGVGDTV